METVAEEEKSSSSRTEESTHRRRLTSLTDLFSPTTKNGSPDQDMDGSPTDDLRLLVQITGTNGTPVHYEGSFKHAERCSYDDDLDDDIYLNFDDGSSHDVTTDGLPLSSLDEIKIRLGGVDVQRFNIDGLIIHLYDGLYDEETRTEDIQIYVPSGSGPVEYVHGYIGPLPLGWQQKHVPQHAGDDMLLTDLLERVADENNDLTPQTLIIYGLSFREKDITPGIMSLIKCPNQH